MFDAQRLSEVFLAAQLNVAPPVGWTALTQGQLGLVGGDPAATLVPYESSLTTGLKVYQNTASPSQVAIVFTPVPFAELEILDFALGDPDTVATQYADYFADVYSAVAALVGIGGEVLLTGFSLGGVAVNQLAERVNDEFAAVNLDFIAFGTSYVSNEPLVTNVGAVNDWLYGFYNEYADLYVATDAGLGLYPTLSTLLNAGQGAAIYYLPLSAPSSFLNGLFDSPDRGFASTNATLNWHFSDGPFSPMVEFTRETNASSHSTSDYLEVLNALSQSEIGVEVTQQTQVAFHLAPNGTGGVFASGQFLDVDAATSSNPSVVYSFGADNYNWSTGGFDTIDHVLNGHSGTDIMEGLAGNDTLYGQSGDDRLYGGIGNDILSGGFGNDYHSGGDGYDTVYFDGFSTSYLVRQLIGSDEIEFLRSVDVDIVSTDVESIVFWDKTVDLASISKTIYNESGAILGWYYSWNVSWYKGWGVGWHVGWFVGWGVGWNVNWYFDGIGWSYGWTYGWYAGWHHGWSVGWNFGWHYGWNYSLNYGWG
ncbi:MAG: hypothetical protein AAGK33_09260 [Pseudomonadota bacterium]